MITSERVFEFVDLLDKYISEHPKSQYCDMGTVGMYEDCNTPGCHAGWAGFVLGVRVGHWTFGADALATFLYGKETHYTDLEMWAHMRPAIWGNTSGYQMFRHGEAFGQDFDKFPVCVIRNHWLGVAKRLKERKNVVS
jgi:hypothetical protein